MKKFLLLALLLAGPIALIAQDDDDTERRSAKSKNTKQAPYGQNIIAFNPLHAIADNHVGVGFSYERLLNPYIGLKVPVMKSVNSNYVNVGLEAKLYPGRHNGVVRYAIAPTLMFGTGDETRRDWVYDPVLGYSVSKTIRSPRTHFGFLLNQTLNITIMRQLYIGMDGGLGVNYYDDKRDLYTGIPISNTITLAAQFHMALGFRF